MLHMYPCRCLHTLHCTLLNGLWESMGHPGLVLFLSARSTNTYRGSTVDELRVRRIGLCLMSLTRPWYIPWPLFAHIAHMLARATDHLFGRGLRTGLVHAHAHAHAPLTLLSDAGATCRKRWRRMQLHSICLHMPLPFTGGVRSRVTVTGEDEALPEVLAHPLTPF